MFSEDKTFSSFFTKWTNTFLLFVLMHILLTIIFLTNVIAHLSIHVCLEDVLKNDYIMIMIMIKLLLLFRYYRFFCMHLCKW